MRGLGWNPQCLSLSRPCAGGPPRGLCTLLFILNPQLCSSHPIKTDSAKVVYDLDAKFSVPGPSPVPEIQF